jgi:hypothetical protein
MPLCSEAQELPSGANIATPTEFKWTGSLRGETAVLLGDPRKPVRYVQRSKWPADTINLPHQHPEDEEITVISGTWYLGLGMTMDPGKATALPPKSFVVMPAKTWRFFFTKSDEEGEFRGTGPREIFTRSERFFSQASGMI